MKRLKRLSIGLLFAGVIGFLVLKLWDLLAGLSAAAVVFSLVAVAVWAGEWIGWSDLDGDEEEDEDDEEEGRG